eukprot:9472381-Pyramimonas_sp.AAC.1
MLLETVSETQPELLGFRNSLKNLEEREHRRRGGTSHWQGPPPFTCDTSTLIRGTDHRALVSQGHRGAQKYAAELAYFPVRTEI